MAGKLRFDDVFINHLKDVLPISLVAEQFVKLTRKGGDYVGLSPFKPEKTGSFTVNDSKGFYHCFATGEHGNQIDLVMALSGRDFVDSVRYLAGLAGIELPENVRIGSDGSQSGGMDEKERARIQQNFLQKAALREKEAQEKAEKFKKMAWTLWCEGRKSEGTVVESYLAGRGIDLDALQSLYGWRVPPSLKYHPSAYYDRSYRGPCMIGILQDAKGRFTGLHRTWLLRDGRGKAPLEEPKKTMGEVWGSGIRLSKVGAHCLCGEGIETTLSVMGRLAGRGERIFGFCGVALGNIAGAGQRLEGKALWQAKQAGGGKMPFNRRPDPERPGLVLPNDVKQLDLLADADGKDLAFGRNMMERAAEKFVKHQKIYDVYIANPLMGQDFNDMAQREAAE